MAAAALALCVAGGLAACGDRAGSAPPLGSADPAVAGEADDAAAVLVAPPPTTSLVIEGEPVNPHTLAPGDCTNVYTVDGEVITTRVSCELPHHREVYATVSHPAPFGEPWPGEEALQATARRECHARFAAYVGVIYELSVFGIGTLVPPQANWDDERARFRTITCHLTAPGGQLLVGSMRGKAR